MGISGSPSSMLHTACANAKPPSSSARSICAEHTYKVGQIPMIEIGTVVALYCEHGGLHARFDSASACGAVRERLRLQWISGNDGWAMLQPEQPRTGLRP